MISRQFRSNIICIWLTCISGRKAHGEGQDGWEEQGVPEHGLNYTSPEKALYGVKKLRDLYFKAQPDYDARFTVPIIWDLKTETIVNNESSEIIRIFNTAFDDLLDEKYKGVTYYPEKLRKDIDGLNEWCAHVSSFRAESELNSTAGYMTL